jgi:hypothetical protein
MIVLISLLLICVGLGQAKPDQDRIILSSSETPVRLTLSPNKKYVEVTNYSYLEVRTLVLGCAAESADGITLKKRIEEMDHFNLAKIDLPAADWEKSRLGFFTFMTSDEIVRDCQRLNSALAVIEIRFADGSTWTLPKKPN